MLEAVPIVEIIMLLITLASCASLGGAVALGAPPCEGVTFYASLTDWTAATSDASIKVTFDEPSWPVNTPLYGVWTLNGLSFQGFAGAPQPNIWVTNAASPFGSGRWLVANGDENINVTPESPVHALAIDATANNFGPAFVKVIGTGGNEMASLTIPQATHRFVGITSGQPILRINFSSTLGAVVDTGFDTVRLASYAVDPAGDLDGDGEVGGADLAILLGAWGPCRAPCCDADLDQSGAIDAADLAILLGAWG